MKRGFFLSGLLLLLTTIESNAWVLNPGEQLKYEVTLMGLKFGTVSLVVKDKGELWEIFGQTDFVTTPFLPALNYQFGSLVSKENGLPKEFYQEKNGIRQSVIFDQKKGQAVYSNAIIKILPKTYDLLSAFYHLRSLKEKEKETVNVHFKRANIVLYPKLQKDKERKTIFGKLKTFYLNIRRLPYYQSSFEIWFSDSEARIPLEIKGEITVYGMPFNFVAKLIGFESL